MCVFKRNVFKNHSYPTHLAIFVVLIKRKNKEFLSCFVLKTESNDMKIFKKKKRLFGEISQCLHLGFMSGINDGKKNLKKVFTVLFRLKLHGLLLLFTTCRSYSKYRVLIRS